LDNFYKIPTETVYEEIELPNGEKERRPVMVKSQSGKIVEKTKKSRKKQIIKDCLSQSPMFLSKFDCVIIDEAHKLSNNTSIRYKVIEDFLARSKPQYVFLLTGTPLTNRPMNLYNVLKLIDAEVTHDYDYYVNRYCDGQKMTLSDGREITLSNGASNLDELKEKIKHVYIRRLLTDMTDMVDKNIETRYYDLSEAQMKRYEELWDEYVKAQIEQGNDDSEEYRQLVEGTLVRQYLAKEMIANTIQLADEKIEDGEKVIIICTFTDEINELKKYYGNKCVVYDGKITSKRKDKAEYEFMNNPKIKVFIGQIIACSVGLTLTAAYTLIFNSYSWVAADNIQAEDRIFRINQTHDVTCIYQLFNDSISQNMFDKVMRKKVIMAKTIKSEKEK
jgi:SWI/SNF-related matrix-associated actin-dependent regulator 1 of chromatin subfamily A